METENVFADLRSSPPKSTEVEASTALSKDEAVYRPECNSPDPSCAICLGKLENKSFTDSCFHQFCFNCLLEWSKVKAECPLCKQSFKSIIHNVRSIEDYDQYHLRSEEPPRSWESPDGWRFRYRSTLTSERRREMALERRLLGHVSRSACIYRSLRSHRPSAVTTDFRRTVYDRNWWVQPTELTRYRDVSPQFYRANPACTHRLIPWLNRELVVLLYEHESRISFVLELILSLIQRYEILSPEFREHVRPYIFGRTEHFIHEFYNYARCPWDMRAYDQRAVYRDLQVTRSSSDSNDSDIIIVETPTASTSGTEPSQASSQPPSLIDQTNLTSASQSTVLAVTMPTETHDPEPPSNISALDRVKSFLSNVGRTGWESPSTSAPGWESPTRGNASYGNLPNLINIPFLPPSPQPGPSGMTQFLQSVRDDSDSSSSCLLSTAVNIPFLETGSRQPKAEQEEDCFIVACVKPVRERTPLVVNLVSDSDDDSVMHVKHEPHENECHERPTRSRKTTSRSSSSSMVTPSSSRSPSRSHVGSSSRSRTRDRDELSSPTSLTNDNKSSKRYRPPPPHAFAARQGSRSLSRSPDHWRWTAYENGGGKLQRSYSRSSSGEPLPRLPSVVGEVHGMLAKRKKHKKHKHKHKSHHHHHHHDKHKFKKHCKGHKNSSKSHH